MRVLLAVDFSPGSEKAIQVFADRSWPSDVLVRVMGVVPRFPPFAAELWFDAGGDTAAMMQTRKQNVEELVVGVAAMLKERGIETETAVVTGRRRKSLSLEARLWKPDVIVDAARDLRKLSATHPDICRSGK